MADDNNKRKRSAGDVGGDEEYSSVKRLATEESRKPETFSPREGSQSPESEPRARYHSHSSTNSQPSPTGIKADKLRIDMNQNVNSHTSDEEEENVSAFRKVEKHANIQPSLGSPTEPHQQPYDLTSPSTRASALFNPSLRSPPKVLPGKTLGLEPGMLPRYPLLTPGAVPPAFLASTGLSENLSMNLAELYRNPVRLAGMSRPVVDKLGDINNIENNNIIGKLPPYLGTEGRGMGVPMPFGYYKSPNPMVDKILNTNTPAPAPVLPNLANLASNWCAKCNATFRMTSDLVYHMRSHHKSNVDPMRKKREDKLRCNICGETFRERHHLTRHMTSHA